MRARWSTALAVVMLTLFTLPALSAEGRRPIWQPGTVVSAPGKYFVSRNLTATTAGPVIQVTADDVEIDLNGMVLDARGIGGNLIEAANVSGLVLRDGTLLGGDEAIFISDARRVLIEEIKAEEQTFWGMRLVSTDNFVLRRNRVMRSAGRGILIDGAGTDGDGMVEGIIERNLISENEGGIEIIAGFAVQVLHNTIRDVSSNGILLDRSRGCLLSENTVHDTVLAGIRLEQSKGNKLYNNVVSVAELQGIVLDENSPDNLVLNNEITANLDVGLRVDSFRNHLEGNVMNSNSSWGLHITGSTDLNLFRRNTARGNFGNTSTCTGFIVTPDACVEGGADNTSHGDNYMPGMI